MWCTKINERAQNHIKFSAKKNWKKKINKKKKWQVMIACPRASSTPRKTDASLSSIVFTSFCSLSKKKWSDVSSKTECFWTRNIPRVGNHHITFWRYYVKTTSVHPKKNKKKHTHTREEQTKRKKEDISLLINCWILRRVVLIRLHKNPITHKLKSSLC